MDGKVAGMGSCDSDVIKATTCTARGILRRKVCLFPLLYKWWQLIYEVNSIDQEKENKVFTYMCRKK